VSPVKQAPFFVIRRSDGAVIGEIGCSVDGSGTGMTGYGLVRSAWGHGYATEALRAVLAHALALPGMQRVVGDAPVDRPASGRVMEKAGMRETGRRHSVEDGVSMELVRYETGLD